MCDGWLVGWLVGWLMGWVCVSCCAEVAALEVEVGSDEVEAGVESADVRSFVA